MAPSLMSNMRRRSFVIVDFPAPEEPTSAMRSPPRTARSKSSSTGSAAPKEKFTRLKRIAPSRTASGRAFGASGTRCGSPRMCAISLESANASKKRRSSRLMLNSRSKVVRRYAWMSTKSPISRRPRPQKTVAPHKRPISIAIMNRPMPDQMALSAIQERSVALRQTSTTALKRPCSKRLPEKSMMVAWLEMASASEAVTLVSASARAARTRRRGASGRTAERWRRT
ncbi:MAG: hypothetical protein UY98_C0030G0007 [Candidatus Kaiserbacteria bacterium GW2011_GWA2_58_9]|uniref:Uncharacterized protein n=1 Tax=Candidatus Kaiserbacteria bacterium GW2011_GWA2_58_9 TaxID=1618672 RepID=A0A0G2BKD9_9BACT|nr:MAG: hypothetical protein UY98_C0030G0007 [Candidatus Kaiserbacteria bacterium GW2011_GWA2_58_9]